MDKITIENGVLVTPERLRHEIRRLREKSGISQIELWQAAGIGQGYVSMLECGHRWITLDTFVRISSALYAKTGVRIILDAR